MPGRDFTTLSCWLLLLSETSQNMIGILVSDCLFCFCVCKIEFLWKYQIVNNHVDSAHIRIRVQQIQFSLSTTAYSYFLKVVRLAYSFFFQNVRNFFVKTTQIWFCYQKTLYIHFNSPKMINKGIYLLGTKVRWQEYKQIICSVNKRDNTDENKNGWHCSYEV